MSVISRLKSFQVRPFLTCLCAALVYPLIVLITSEKKLLKFIDALTITGLILLILGVVYSLIRHGVCFQTQLPEIRNEILRSF